MTEQRIVGVDPGLGTTGYGVIAVRGATIELVEGGTIRPANRRAPIEQRLATIFGDISALLREMQPVVVAIEDVYTRYERPRTAILMGHARGVIALAAGLANIPVEAYTASQVKRALTGEGRASKGQVQRAVAEVLGLPRVPEPPDVADALALALTCANARRG
ncbi:MAG: crossover junction endodeoxyribonuclease RuvC [Chloroflexota bacterium]|nr:crossover junction endodeoxyribonuclease RuvC [Dehalococcoidia bacterium]MDW8254357.1 crossover junction endodeoxyribonuclease RuvC [Chloroflexota bacterium]